MQVLFSKGTSAANHIANNLQNSHAEAYFWALRDAPLDLLRVPF